MFQAWQNIKTGELMAARFNGRVFIRKDLSTEPTAMGRTDVTDVDTLIKLLGRFGLIEVNPSEFGIIGL